MSIEEEVYEFWFGELDDKGRASEEKSRVWFLKEKDLEFDRKVRERFEGLYGEVVAGKHERWLDTPRGRLIYVVVLDQFARHIFRGSANMYAADEQALRAAKEGIGRGEDKGLAHAERKFLYMPLMHSENLDDQRRCLELFTRWRDEVEGQERAEVEDDVRAATRHLVIVERFGRFPHRNKILGRESTVEEAEFLTSPGSSF